MTPTPAPLRPETLVAADAVVRALELTDGRAGHSRITAKGGRDLVTATDLAVEDAVRRFVSDALGTSVVGEERGGEAPADGAPYWLVDPVCGTRNFASGTPLFCVNLALVERGQIAIAAVGDPSTHEILVAERGGGAWALAQPAMAERAPGGATWRVLDTSAESRTIVIEDGKAAGARREHAARFIAGALRADRWDFRSLGTTLSLAYVATGRVSAYAVCFASAIHTAAGSLLVTQAGGALSDLEGRPWTLESDSLLAAATPALHRELLDLARATGDAVR
jgi:myo-inositol-1(or 4)-monophosphatase